MRFRLWTSRALFVLSGLLLLIGSVAWAGPKEDVAAATMKWAQTLGQNDPDKVILLYATDGVLWGMLSPTVRADRAALSSWRRGAGCSRRRCRHGARRLPRAASPPTS